MAFVGSHFRGPALLAALAGLVALGGQAAAAPSPDPVTERVRQILGEDGGDAEWGAEPPAGEIAERGEPVAVTILSGVGHALVMIDADGQPAGSHLRLLHVGAEGAGASATECVLRLGLDQDRSCPPAPPALVDCATWSVPAEAVRDAALEARAALFVRIYEKKFITGPRQEVLDEEGVEGGVSGSVSGGTTHDFLAAASVIESGAHRIRVSAEWAGYASARAAGRYARADAAAAIARDAFPRPSDAPAAPPPAAVHAEFSRLLATLPLDEQYWWWVRERLVLMAGALGLPADLPRLEGYLDLTKTGPSELRTRAYALDSLARRTGRDPRCDGTRRLDDAAAAAAWAREVLPVSV
jgi:hypothetical protein